MFDKIVEQGKLTELDAASIIFQCLDALSCMHAQGIVHRDLKPENILLRSPTDKTVVLVDFGVSTYLEDDQLLSTLCGSPAYIAPEGVI